MAVLPIGIGSAAGAGGFNVERSLRFNSADSAYLNRTPASAGNRKTWTWSGWVKRSAIDSGDYTLFSCCPGGSDNSNYFNLLFNNNTIRIESYSIWRITTPLYRDPSAWYHVVVTIDTTNATASNRVKLYVNGVEVTTFSTNNNPTLNEDLSVNRADAHQIGRRGDTFAGLYLNGYMTEINFIDGQALTPSSFGETDSNTGVWKPKAFSGTYGTNGFYLKFADNSGTTSTTLGKDSSGNGNNWTPNNFSVTAGAGNDSLVDSPTAYGTDTGVGGEVRGNYATLNPLDRNSNVTLSNGNLYFSVGATPYAARATFGMTSGKWYWEVQNPSSAMVGIMTSFGGLASYVGADANGWGYYFSNGNKYNNGASAAYGNSYTNTDTIGVAFDADNGKLYFSKNGTWQASGDPVAGTNAAYTGLTSGPYFAALGNGSQTSDINFGQRPFAYTAPSGFKALCTQNLPTPTIGATSTTQANDYFNPVLYTGNGSTNNITGVGFQPDFVWLKDRTTAFNNYLYDAVRGTTKALQSNSTNAEETRTGLTAFGSDGFTLGSQGGDNQSGDSFVAWNWKANGAGSTNTAGTITSTVSANTTSGFSIVTWTGSGTLGTVGHGLGIEPKMIINFRRGLVGGGGTGASHIVYHERLNNGTNPANYFLLLDSTAATYGPDTTVANNTKPTTSVFTVNTDGWSNASGYAHVAYCFAPVAGYSAFGSYTGNGSTDGPMIFTGFRPRYLMVKEASGTSAASGNWVIHDAVRDTYNVCGLRLVADNSYAEGTVNAFDFLSNGFKLRTTDAGRNESGGTYIYMAFAESPFKYSLAR